jgi:hypothetical protein
VNASNRLDTCNRAKLIEFGVYGCREQGNERSSEVNLLIKGIFLKRKGRNKRRIFKLKKEE